MPNGNDFEKKLADWEKKTQLYQEQAVTSQLAASDYGKQIETKPTLPLSPWGRWLKTNIPVLYDIMTFPAPAELKPITPEERAETLSGITAELETSDFFARLYGEVPFAISAGRVSTPDEVLSLLRPPASLTADELREVQDTILDMIATITRPPEVPEVVELEEEYPELVAPTPPPHVRVPVSIHQLSVQEILRALKIPRVPEGAMSQEQWNEFLKLKGYTDEDIDNELQLKAEELIASWQDRNSQIEAFRTGLAEMPEYKVTDMLKEMVVQPGLALAEVAMIYFEHVSMPLAGMLYKNFIPDLEAEYQRFKAANPDAPEREALVHAWMAWDAPFEGWQSWVLKYMIMEGLVDPLTYVGWGIATKVANIPAKIFKVGRWHPLAYPGRLVGALEQGAAAVFEAPFDALKYIYGKIPKTLTQRATMAQHQATQYVERYLTRATGRHLSSISMNDFTKASERAIKYAMNNPQLEDDIALAGREMLKHSPVDEAMTRDWAKRLDTTLLPEDITRTTVENMDNLFEDMFRWKLITPREAAGQMLKTLNVGEITDAALKTAQRILETRAATIQRGAIAFTRAKTPLAAMRSLASKNFKTHIAVEESAAALARKETGAFSTLLHNVDLRLQGIWRNGIDRWVVRPFAESYLTFGMYGPMNVLEDYIRSSLGGVFPRRMNIEAWEKLTIGLKVDPELKRYGISEMIGPLAREGPEREWNNWILQLFALGQKGWADKIYKTLVRIPGAYGMDVRRNFLSKRYLQLLAEAGGDEFVALAKTGPKNLPKLADRKLIRDLEATVYSLKTTGNPDAIRGAKDLFTRQRVVRNEVRSILNEHPELPNTARDYIMRAFDEDVLFREVRRVTNWERVRFEGLEHEQIKSIKGWIDNLPFDIKLELRGVRTVQGLPKARYLADDRIIELPPRWEKSTFYHEIGHDLIEQRVDAKDIPFFEDFAKAVYKDKPQISKFELKKIEAGEIKYEELFALHEDIAERFMEYAMAPGDLAKKFPNISKFMESRYPKVSRPVDTIEMTINEARTILLDDFIRGPEVATQQYHQLADFLTALEVRNPQEMASAIQAVHKMSEIYGALPDQIIAQATIRSRGLPLAERRATFDADFDRIYQFLDAAGADIDRVLQKLKLTQLPDRVVPNRFHYLTEYIDTLPLEGQGAFSDLVSFIDNYSQLAVKGIDFPDYGVDMLFDIVKKTEPGFETGPFKVAYRDALANPTRLNKVVAIDLYAQIAHADATSMLPHVMGVDIAFWRGRKDTMLVLDKMSQILRGIFDDLQQGSLTRMTVASPKYAEASTRLFDTMTAKRQYATEFRAQNMATRHEIFAGVSKKEMTPEFWDNFYLQMNNEYRILNIRMAELDSQLVKSIEEMNIAAGVRIPSRAPVVVKERPLAPQDVATLLGVRGDDISRALLDVLTVQNNKDFFVAYVRGMTRTGDIGFTKEAIEAVYDQISYSLRVAPESMSWITSKQMELDGVRRELHSLYNSKMLPDEEITSIGRYLDDTADAVEKLMYEPEALMVTGYRLGTVKPTTGAIATEGEGLYVAKNRELASFFRERGVAGRQNIRTVKFGEPKNPLEASGGHFVLFEDEAIFQPVRRTDTEWVKMQKQAAKNVGVTTETWEAKLPELNREISNLARKSGYDAIDCGEWFVLLDEALWKAPPKVPARALKTEYANFDDLRQSAMDEAHKWYYKEYPDYTNANAFDAMMKTIYPYWTYESQRWFWLPRAFVRHPGLFTTFERWQNNSDYGYIHIPGTSVDINPFRGTIFGTLTTRLTRRDFPEYYDSLGAAGGLVEFNDYLSRFGFYPGAHISIPIAMMGGLEQQMGETMPSIWKTPLNALIAARPESESVKWLSDHIFSDRFRDYMTILQVNKRGYRGSHIWTKIKEGLDLTEEEQAIWDESRGEAALHGVFFEQFALFRLRTDEQYKAYEESAKVIEEMTGYTPEQQDWLRRHGYRLWDIVGGLSPTNQAILQELEAYKWLGTVTPLLPSRQQLELRRLDLDWDDVMQYSEANQVKKLELQQEFMSGRLGPRDYTDRLQDIYSEQRTYIDKKMEDNPNMTLEGRKEYYKKYGIPTPVQHPMKELLNLYFSIELEDKHDEDTGELVADWDSFFAQRNAIEDAIPEELKQEWEAYLSRNTTRIEEVRRNVSNTYFRKYYDVWEASMAAYPENEQQLINEFLYLERTGQQLERQVEIREMVSTKTGNQLISSFRSDVSDSRAALRYANPHLDAWLYFWGRTTAFKTPQAEAIYQQISKDIGRRI